MTRSYHLDEKNLPLAEGTRVVLKAALPAVDGYHCKAGTVGRVVEAAYGSYVVKTPQGRRIKCARDQLVIQKRDLLSHARTRKATFEDLEPHIIYSAIVGSQAWKLADDKSDVDIKGVFVLPWDDYAGLWRGPDEISSGEAQYWEAQKAVYQGLRADANTLETLWSPLVQVSSELGRELVAKRRMFVSKHIFGTFGRYAMSQFKKMRSAGDRRRVSVALAKLLRAEPDIDEPALVARLCSDGGVPGFSRAVVGPPRAEKHARRLIKDIYRSLFDQGLLEERGYGPLAVYLRSVDLEEVAARPIVRWKNAYNLLRLLHSGTKWLREGEPLIEVEGDTREELLVVKSGRMELAEVLARAEALSSEMERAFETTKLPDDPDYAAAHEYLLRCRRSTHDARRRLTPAGFFEHEPPAAWAPQRLEYPQAKLGDFLDQYDKLGLVLCGLVGSHSYGFPSVDSDFDLKAIHLAPRDAVLGLTPPKETVEHLGMWEELEIDFTSHEARPFLVRMLKGDGNALERIFSPYQLLPTSERVRELRAAAHRNLSRRVHRHYRGFMGGSLKRFRTAEKKRIKDLLYIFRVGLTGVHLLEAGQVIGDLVALIDRYPLPGVTELISRKEAAEKASLDDTDNCAALIPQVEAMLDNAHDRSPLPQEPPEPGLLDDWLIRWRR